MKYLNFSPYFWNTKTHTIALFSFPVIFTPLMNTQIYVDHFIKHKPLISEEWVGKYLFDKKKACCSESLFAPHRESCQRFCSLVLGKSNSTRIIFYFWFFPEGIICTIVCLSKLQKNENRLGKIYFLQSPQYRISVNKLTDSPLPYLCKNIW